MSTLTMLMKRESWEYRGAFLITPIAIASITIIMTWLFIGVQMTPTGEVVSEGLLEKFSVLPITSQGKAVRTIADGIAVPFIIVLFVVIANYLLSSLYTERKDRSILFWRSLPVSDTYYVLSKVLVGLVIVPLFTILLMLIVQLICMSSAALMVSYLGFNSSDLIWQHLNIAEIWGSYLVGLLFYILWSAPVTGWLLLISSFARSNPFLWATLPILGIGLLENVLTRSSSLVSFVGQRIIPSDIEIISGNEFDFSTITLSEQLQLLTSSDLWLGLILAGIFISGAILLRRYTADAT